MAELPIFEIHVEPDQRLCSVKMDGNDITAGVAAIAVNHDFKIAALPEVTIVFKASDVHVTGQGEAFAQLSGPTIAAMLDQIDAQELETEALNRAAYGENVTATALQILKERFSAEA